MSALLLGSQVRLSLGSPLVEVTGIGYGIDNITRNQSIDYRELPGGTGITTGQRGRFVAHDFAFSCISNSIQDPLLRAAHGTRQPFQLDRRPGESDERFTGSSILSVSLAMNPTSDAVSFTVAATVDGDITVGNAGTDNRRPLGLSAYKAQRCEIYWGGLLLNPAWQGALQVQGSVATGRSRVQRIGQGPIGVTADVTRCGFTASIGLRLGPELAAVLDSPDDSLVIRRRDANYGIALPLVVRSIAEAIPINGVMTQALQFGPSAGQLPVDAVPVASTTTLTVGQVGYSVNPGTGVTYKDTTGSLAVATGGFAVIGSPHVANNAAP